MVTAPDGVTSKVYMLTVRRAAAGASSDAALSDLTLQDLQGNAIDLDPVTFSSTTTDYTASVTFEVGEATVTATPHDADAVALILSADGRHARGSLNVDLPVGDTAIKVMVNAADATTAKVYNLTVTRAPSEYSDDATLSALTVEDGSGVAFELTPAFDPATTEYSASAPYHAAGVVVSATKNHAAATATVIETDGTATEDSAVAVLAVGENLIKVMITAEDGSTTLIYRITIARAPAWSATLTVGTDTSYAPTLAGFTTWGRVGALSTRVFEVDSTRYGVMTLMSMGGGLYLTTHKELPGDFTLSIGDQEFFARDSLEHVTPVAGNYWWSAEGLTWAQGDTLDVSITPVEDSENTLTREKAPPTASFLYLPDSHSGTEPFQFRLYFSDDVDIDSASLRDHSLQVTNGTTTRVEQTTEGSSHMWRITVQPDSGDDVTVTLPATQDCATQGAICTADGRRLHNTVEVTIPPAE